MSIRRFRSPAWLDRFNVWLNVPGVGIDIQTWWLIAGVLLVISAISRQPIIAMLAIGLALIGLALRLYWDVCFKRLGYRRALSAKRAFWGEPVELTLAVENRKPIPLSRLEVTERANRRVSIEGHQLSLSAESNYRTFDSVYSLGLYERVTHRYQLNCRRRGWHTLGPTDMLATDPWGVVSRRQRIDSQSSVLVYPRMVPIDQLVVPARQPLGDFKPSTPLVEDPMRVSGVRPYVPGDSPRRIHWRATARTGELQTRIFEPSANPVAALFLDTQMFSNIWGDQKSDHLEFLIVVAASLARQLLGGKHQVGLYVNAPAENSRHPIRISPGRRSGQLPRILEQLASLTPLYGQTIAEMVGREFARLPWGASIVVITSQLTVSTQRTFLRLARSAGANRFVFIVVGAEPELLPEARSRFTVYTLDTEEAWDVLETIHFTRVS